MIEYKTGNILQAGADALVNSVNCVGVMGRGVALQFKHAFPDNFKSYAAVCRRGEMKPGRVLAFATETLTKPRWIINFPTKRHWRGMSRMRDIEAGLADLATVIAEHKITSLAIPPLGCGLGGLQWPQVRACIEANLREVTNCKIIVFEPCRDTEMADLRRNLSTAVPEMTAGRAALVMLMHRYLLGGLDPFVTLLEVHKLLYFLQSAGEPLKLHYKKAPYGPYAENLRHVLQVIEGHLIVGYNNNGDKPYKPLHLVPGALEDAKVYSDQNQPTQTRLERVSDLVDGFESPSSMELLASVHWLVAEEQARDEQEATMQMHAWSPRKKENFTAHQIGIAYKTLQTKGWFAAH